MTGTKIVSFLQVNLNKVCALTFIHDSLAQQFLHLGHLLCGNSGNHFASFEDFLC